MAVTPHPQVAVFAVDVSRSGAKWDLEDMVSALTHPESDSYNHVTFPPSMNGLCVARYELRADYAAGDFARQLMTLSKAPGFSALRDVVEEVVVGVAEIPACKAQLRSGLGSARKGHLGRPTARIEFIVGSYSSQSVSQAAAQFFYEFRDDLAAGSVRRFLRRLRRGGKN
ncbi:hypothetical protein AB0L00_04275 [Actinoallomurus sp. NPDC052308]|uniref:hypothetical protein n=1 Tax=Actinoallomurus sp. NPDC052308 TaxID=3155530 RepID=UPI0034373616